MILKYCKCDFYLFPEGNEADMWFQKASMDQLSHPVSQKYQEMKDQIAAENPEV